MSGRTSAQEQAAIVTMEMLADVRAMVPGLVSAAPERAFLIEFDIRIRNGVIDLMDTTTWDDYSRPIHHVHADDPDVQLRRLERWLVKDLQGRLVQGYHGRVIVAITVQNKTLAFSTVVKRQKMFCWGQAADSAGRAR